MQNVFTNKESRFLWGISSVLGIRQLALLIVMPVIAIYGASLSGSSPALVGLALGAYGLFQAFFQIPFGIYSDKVGRKPLVLFGLILLIAGSILAFMANHIYILILARALQGSGAIMAVSYAWVADTIEERKRNQAMGILGLVLGISAIISFLSGPFLIRYLSISQLFLFCGFLSLLSFAYILFLIPNTPAKKNNKDAQISFLSMASQKKYSILFILAFILNYILISIFFIVPQMLIEFISLDSIWIIFVPATLAGILTLRVGTILADRGYFKSLSLMAFTSIILATICLLFQNLALISLSMILFMMAYMFLVTVLPAQISLSARENDRGKATGVFNTFQFLGSFAGGFISGILWGINPLLSISILSFLALIALVILHSLEN